MITLHFVGMCDGCKMAELELHEIERINGEKIWTVSCLHERICDAMVTRICMSDNVATVKNGDSKTSGDVKEDGKEVDRSIN